MNKESLKISIPAIFACILWSTAFPAVKIGLQYCPPLSFAGIRFIISGFILIIFLLFQKKNFSFLKFPLDQWKMILILSLFQTVILYALFFLGLTFVTSAVGAIIIGSSPLITALTTHVITSDDKITKSKLLCILAGIIGIVIITLNKNSVKGGNYSQIIGVIILIISSISSAIGNIIVSKNKNEINPITLTSLQMFMGGLILLLISVPIYGTPKLTLEPTFYIALFWLSSISAVAFSIWFWLLQKPSVQVSELNIWKFIVPVFGVVLSWILIPSEHPNIIIIIGMLIVASSILFYYIPNITGRKKAE